LVFKGENVFIVFYGLCTKLSDNYAGMINSRSRYDLSTELCNEYTTRV